MVLTTNPARSGDRANRKFAALSAALALVAAAVLIASGVLRLGRVMDLVSNPVMTGFLFGLGLTVAMSQLPKVLGVPAGDGGFFPRLADLVRHLDETSWWRLAVGLASIAGLLLLGRVAGAVHSGAAQMLRRAGLDGRVKIEPTLDFATARD
jgi:sulfate permease, SulP family